MSESVQTVAPAPKKELLRGMLAAAGIAAVVLVVAVLPAEYGIDPTGAGKALGLTALHQEAAAPAMPAGGFGNTEAIATELSSVAAKGEERALTITARQQAAYRSDTMEVVLPPGKGLEVKTHLRKGQALIYAWKTSNGEQVLQDFHGEPPNAGKNEFESFIKDKAASESRGVLIAPFTGEHGWYWKNKSAAPVTVILQASGFYTDIVRK
ncbi:transmembrane anchor protein [Pseudoduganella danionis]|uniref:transmembrane anchor protein n=1 Tax=Pseudoduganella danionis TaxID=1890295 RepID=UPI0035AF4D95